MEICKPTIRTVTAFIDLTPSDFEDVTSWGSLFLSDKIESKLEKCVKVLREMQEKLSHEGYQVQTLRIATNPFGEWLIDSESNNDGSKKSKNEKLNRLERLDSLLSTHKIEFCSIGPARNRHEAELCVDIVSKSSKFSCSMNVTAGSVEEANLAAKIILEISKLNSADYLKDGQGNFRFCAAGNCKSYIPFFPAAKSEVSEDDVKGVKFALGLENGLVAQAILKKLKSIGNIRDEFGKEMARILGPIQVLCEKVAKQEEAVFIGIDSSLNPSLDEQGSVASAIEMLDEVKIFGGPGSVAAASQITTSLQSLPGIKLTGYCGLMLPVCEDSRLAQLSSNDTKGRQLRISDLLSISSVCGVGLDTVPIAGDCSKEDLSSIILDMAGVAFRWNKSLSARLFPVPNLKSGDMTAFDSPYLVNASVFSLN